MSFIFGFLYHSQCSETNSLVDIFASGSADYKIEPIKTCSLGNAVFGCGIQRFSTNSDNEVLPIFDAENNILFVSDSVVDNKKDLIKELNIFADSSDSQILYSAYLKWDTDFGDHVCGSFSFAAYHKDQNRLVICSDHMNTRSLFYYADKEIIMFCNAIVPLAYACGAKVSERWSAASLFSTTADLSIYDSLTPYENVYQLKPACLNSFENDKIIEKKYWTPLTIPFDKPEKSESGYREIFIKTFRHCIDEMLQINGNKGCTLSGGLDSTSVAALTALALKDQTLFSFTSVPDKEYERSAGTTKDDGYSITDETEGVKILCEKYDNINAEFVDCAGKDAFSELKKLNHFIGYPMKSAQNLTWLEEIYLNAEKKNIRLMMKGQFGNSTISYGNILSAVYQDLVRFRFRKAADNARLFCTKYHVPKKKFIRIFLSDLFKHYKKPRIDRDNILTNPDLIKKYGTKRDMQKCLNENNSSYMDSRKERLKCLHDPVSLNQLGMFDTIMGLKHGIIIRDPAKDKRMVELCASFPPSCMVAGGVERGQVRTFMEGYVPESILKDVHHRGLQSADYYFRVRKNWFSLKNSIIEALENPELSKYADSSIIQKELSYVRNSDIKDMDDEDIRRINVLYSFSVFLQAFHS